MPKHLKIHMNFFASPARAVALATASLVLAAAPAAHAKDPSISGYFVGVDGLATIASGTYAGLANPNHQRLTFLFAHTYADTPTSNHYHSKGVIRYTGPNLGAGTATEINPNNYLPEGTIPPITLSLAVGGHYDGKLVAAPIAEPDTRHPFSFFTIEDTGKLAGFGPTEGETYLFNSSGGRWNDALTGTDVHLELVSLTPGLNVGVGPDLNAFAAPGDDYHLADSFSFTPTFWTELNADPGAYVAQFKLTDKSGTLGDSGTFEFRFQVAAIPEPSAFATLAGLGALSLAFTRRRRARV
jgi:hypothetical protein